MFAATTFNLGPQTATIPHRDNGNLAFGLCAVYVCGGHQAENGGLLVFHDLKKAFRTRAGDLFIFPSALLTHSNTLVAAGAKRRSIVFWTAAEAVRFVDLGGRRMNQLLPEAQERQYNKEKALWDVYIENWPRSPKAQFDST